MTKRRRISARDREALLGREQRRCHLCGGLVHTGQAWDVSHEIPLACGGADDESNWRVAHRTCHQHHTATVDAPQIAKVRRQRQAHNGSKVSKGPPIQSRGFTKVERARPALTKIVSRRPMFVEETS